MSKTFKYDYITINVDGSYNAETQFGGYAFWILGPQGQLKQFGAFTNKITAKAGHGPILCETMAIANAFYALLSVEWRFDKLIINNDCKTGHKAIETGQSEYPETQYCHALFLKLKTLRKHEYKNKIKEWVEFRHIPAHAANMEGKGYINEWCDLNARNARRKAEGKPPMTMKDKDQLPPAYKKWK